MEFSLLLFLLSIPCIRPCDRLILDHLENHLDFFEGNNSGPNPFNLNPHFSHRSNTCRGHGGRFIYWPTRSCRKSPYRTSMILHTREEHRPTPRENVSLHNTGGEWSFILREEHAYLHTREACPFIREEKCSSIREMYDMPTREAIENPP